MNQIFLRMTKLIILFFIFLTLNSKAFLSTGKEYTLLAICSDPSDDFARGSNQIQTFFGHHSWLALINMGKQDVLINNLKLPVFQAITIATWNAKIHTGIFYNIESYYEKRGEFSSEESVYLMQLLNDFELNRFILELNKAENDTWSTYKNCSYFACKLWNVNAKNKLNLGLIPSPFNLAKEIMKKGGKKGGIYSSLEEKYYYGGNLQKEFKFGKK